MSRISSAMINANALTHLQIAQRDMFEAQRQAATQKLADDAIGYDRDTKSLVTLERMRARGEGYLSAAQDVNLRLSLQDNQLDRSANVIANLKESLTSALALGDLSEVESLAATAFSDIRSAFNSTYNGNYMFGGTVSDSTPIQVNSMAELAANPLADATNNDGEIVQIRIDDARLIQAGPLASDAAQEVLSILRDLQIFNDGANGPFSSNPTELEQDAIKNAMQRLDTAYSNMLEVQAKNGQAMNETDAVIERQQSENDLLESLTADITEVDLAEVALKLNQAQTQYQASASIFSTIQSLSLVDYLG